MKKKKILFVLLCAMMVGDLTAGCGSNKQASPLNPQEPVTVTIWNYYNGDQLIAFEDFVRKFNESVGTEKGIVVESVSQGSIGDLATRLLEAAEGKVGAADVPSAAAIYAETAFILNKQNAIVPLNAYFTEEELDTFIPEFVDEGRFMDEGELYLLPVSKSTETFIVNTTDWEIFGGESGINWDSMDSYEMLTAAAEAYYKWTDEQTPEVFEDGKALYGRDSVGNYVFVGAKQLGHEIFKVNQDASLSVDLDRDTFKILWDNYYIPYINGYFGSYASHRSEDIKTGAILAMTGSTSGVSYISNTVTDKDDVCHDIDVSILKPLSFAAGETPIYVQQGAGYGIMKTTEAQEYAAAEFLKWFTDIEQNLEFSVASGYSPVKVEANDAEKIRESVNAASQKEENMLEALVMSSEVYTSGNTYCSRAFEGSKEARDVLTDALESTSVKDRASVEEKIADGIPREEAVAEYSTEEYFDAWFADLCEQVNKTIGK